MSEQTKATLRECDDSDTAAALRALLALLDAVPWLGGMAVVLALASCPSAVPGAGTASWVFAPAFFAALYALWLTARLRFDRAVLALFLSGELSAGQFDCFLRGLLRKQPKTRDMAARIRGVRGLFARLALSLAFSATWLAVLWIVTGALF